jgi:hypothetical protein
LKTEEEENGGNVMWYQSVVGLRTCNITIVMLCTSFCLVCSFDIVCIALYASTPLIVCIALYTSTPLIQIKWDGEPSGYVENPYNFNFSLKIGYFANLKSKKQFLQTAVLGSVFICVQTKH